MLGFSAEAVPVTIERVEATPLFAKPAEDQPLRQQARLFLDNPGGAFAGTAQIVVGDRPARAKHLGEVPSGKSTHNIQIDDIAAPAPVRITIISEDGQSSAVHRVDWQPQKKWTIYCVSYSHQDLGFGDYPHRLRTSIRHENILLPLRFCRETDDWPAADQYRFNIETSEPITSFISFQGKEAARELAQRLKEGRMELGGLHNTANTEELSHELMARLFYMSGRHVVDLLGVPPNKTMQNDDVIGITWPLATYGAEAGLSYFFHGYNGCGHCLRPAESEPAFFFEAPDSRGRLLMRSTAYGGYAGDGPGDGTEAYMLKTIDQLGAKCPYNILLLQEGTDFQLATRNFANQIHDWNAKWAWPRMVSATMDMFFEALAAQADPARTKTFAADSNNQWSDQDYAAARATGQARRLSELLPATETLASMTQVLAGGGDQWINLFQAYHRLLQYFEHTNAKDNPTGNMVWYETELEENREMAAEAAGYQQQVYESASQRLAGAVARTAEKNLLVFNPLPYERTDAVHADIPAGFVPMDVTTGAKLPVQQLPDGSKVFLAAKVPATGYKTYALVEDAPVTATAEEGALENRFYRLQFNAVTGVITSLFDKAHGVELVESGAPHGFNEYLYEFRTQTTGVEYDSVWRRMEKADTITVSHGPVADVLTVTGAAGGVRQLKQTVTLYHDSPRVDFGIWLDKLPFGGSFPRQHEAVFVALPLAIENFTIRHELPGAVIEPYRQQFEGSATDHYAIRSFTDLSNDKYGVTVSPIEGSLVCYGEPTSSPMASGHEDHFKRDQSYPAHSRLYLYLLNNMFDVNIAADQRGPVSFSWSLRSHSGDWKAGGAARFGRSVQQPMLAWRADGKNAGPMPASGSFMTVDADNVMCSVIKAAEANGRGFILRLNETVGQETTATISLPLLPPIESAAPVSLVENNQSEQYSVSGNTFKVMLPKFGVRTVRITCSAAAPVTVSGLSAEPAADMQVNLAWKCTGGKVSHFNVYRDTTPDCPPTLLNFIGQTSTEGFIDLPRLNMGGWLRSCLKPETTYHYRVVPVDRTNNPGLPGIVVSATTKTSEKFNLPPVAVEGVRPVLVSPLNNCLNFVNVLFRTACEPDVDHYEIYRSTQPGFVPDAATLAGVVKSDDAPPRSGGYGESRIQYKVKDYDHAAFEDRAVVANTTYYYKICAVDTAGQKGGFSKETSVRTKEAFPDGCRVTAQSVFAPEFDPLMALDGDANPFRAWISRPYGGGTKARPEEVWWAVEFLKKPVTIKGVKIFGDHRDVIPIQKNLEIQIRENGAWKTAGESRDAVSNDVTVSFSGILTTDALRVLVPAADLPQSERADVDGIVRICELKLIMPDGTEQGIESGHE